MERRLLSDLLESRLNEALGQTLSRARCQQCACERIGLGHKEIPDDPPSQNEKLSTGSGIRCSNVAGLIKIARFLRSLPPTYEIC